MMNQQAMDSLYSATYMEDFLDCVENLPDDIQRNISRMRDLDYSYTDYMKELEAAMEDLMEEYDYEQETQNMDEEELSNLTTVEEIERMRRHGKYMRARSKVQEYLVRAQDIGDEKLQLAQNVQDNVENKARQLELDRKNLEYGREMENSEITIKEERERPGIKRARRAKHEVYVPSIMGPSTLEVTSYTSIMETPGPSKMNLYKVKSEPASPPKSTSGSSTSHNQEIVEKKTVIKKEPVEEQPRHSGRGSERNHKNSDRGGDSEGTGHTRASERSTTSSAATSTPMKAAVNKKETISEKKGKKRKSKQSKNQDFSPPDDADTIDPDEPTYCLCDQISYGEMIGCDNDLCPIEWFHFSCVSLTHKPKGKWYCPRCRGDKPNVMKNRTVLIKELAKYNREREEKA